LEAFPVQVLHVGGQPRDVAARACHARDKAVPNRVAPVDHDDRDRRRRLLGRPRCGRGEGHDDADLLLHQLGGLDREQVLAILVLP
jgi:hypothetical protein